MIHPQSKAAFMPLSFFHLPAVRPAALLPGLIIFIFQE